jgi:hypothetical protein
MVAGKGINAANNNFFLINQLLPGLPVHPGLLGLLRRVEASTNYGPFRTTLVACIKYNQDAREKKVCSSQVARKYVYTCCTNKFCRRNGIYISNDDNMFFCTPT